MKVSIIIVKQTVQLLQKVNKKNIKIQPPSTGPETCSSRVLAILWPSIFQVWIEAATILSALLSQL